MKKVLIALGVVVALIVIVAVIGLLQPASHTATHAATLAAPPEQVWATITDFERQPAWVPEITGVERLPDRDGRPSYREDFDGFTATTVVTVFDPPRRLVKEILPGGAFSGSWTWDLVPEADGTLLTITERATVRNPIFRAMMIFHDETRSARAYAEALARRLAESGPPRP
jgi:uncharacterized protein YndB with AHSA1/START domain